MKARRLFLLVIALGLLLGAALLASPGQTLDLSGVYLNMVFKGYPLYPLALTGAWTADATNMPEADFSAGEAIQYFGSGVNSGERVIDVDLSWSLSNYCGETTLHTDTMTLSPGDWTATFSQTAPGCSGVSDYTFQASYSERQVTASAQLTVTNPVAPTVMARPAFDKCDNASLQEMSVWWPSSPYWASNIYIGGVHRACPNADLTPEWVRAVMAQGWTLIPTWVGPQAPCSTYPQRFSYDLTEAYQQGRAEADAASVAAAALGLTSYGSGSTIIYYDLEGYARYVTTACRAAAKSFVNGWVERMHELGNQAGMYGGAYSSYASDWATVPNVPDDVWLAVWYTTYYDPAATVWVPEYVSNDLWADHQRLRQYTGGHNETWGGVTLNIDSNVTDGAVVDLLPAPETVDTAQKERTAWASDPAVEGLGALSAEQAWVLLDGRLYLTVDGGAGWIDLSPGAAPIQAATFLDVQHGWLVSASEAGGLGYSLWRTADGGQSWQEMPFAPANAALYDARPVALDFISPQEGWLSMRLASSANFNLGMLFYTRDGGLTWEERSLPGGGAIDFISQDTGWTLAGPEGNVPYQTQDGGLTWQPASPAAEATLRMRDPLRGSLPEAIEVSYVTENAAWAISRYSTCSRLSCTSHSGLWRTLDRGMNWAPVALPGGD